MKLLGARSRLRQITKTVARALEEDVSGREVLDHIQTQFPSHIKLHSDIRRSNTLNKGFTNKDWELYKKAERIVEFTYTGEYSTRGRGGFTHNAFMRYRDKYGFPEYDCYASFPYVQLWKTMVSSHHLAIQNVYELLVQYGEDIPDDP